MLWPRTGFTKGELLDYYRYVAPWLLPHLAGRALTLGRFPAGVEARGFAQTECRGRPDWLSTAPLPTKSGEVRRYCLVNDLPSLLWVANLNTVELHPFLALAERPDRPTALVFDLDPGYPAGLAECARVALLLRDLLAELGLAAFAKTSGSVGLHVYVPLNTPHSYDETKAFARATAARLAAERPELVTDVMRKSLREGKVLVDWLQNDPTRSTVAPYSLRATEVPSVSAPVGWEELAATPESLVFTPADVRERLARRGDVFRPVLERKQQLPRSA